MEDNRSRYPGPPREAKGGGVITVKANEPIEGVYAQGRGYPTKRRERWELVHVPETGEAIRITIETSCTPVVWSEIEKGVGELVATIRTHCGGELTMPFKNEGGGGVID